MMEDSCIHERMKWVIFSGGYNIYTFCALDGTCTAYNQLEHKDGLLVEFRTIKHRYTCSPTCSHRIGSDFLYNFRWDEVGKRLYEVSLKKDIFPGATIVEPSKGVQTLPLSPEIIEAALDKSNLEPVYRAKIVALLSQQYAAPSGAKCFECGEPVSSSLKTLVYDINEGEPHLIGTAWLCKDYPACLVRRHAKLEGIELEYLPPPKSPPVKPPRPIQVDIFDLM